MDKRVSNAAIRAAWLDPTMTSATAAASVGLTRAHFWKRASALGLPSRPSGRRLSVPQEKLPLMQEMWERGDPRLEIAKAFGVAEQTPSALAKRFGWTKRISNGAITRDDLEDCRALWISGMPLAEIGARFGVKRRAVAETARRHGWTGRVARLPKLAVSLDLTREMWEGGVMLKDIAAMTRKDGKTIKRIAGRLRWKTPSERRKPVGTFIGEMMKDKRRRVESEDQSDPEPARFLRPSRQSRC